MRTFKYYDVEEIKDYKIYFPKHPPYPEQTEYMKKVITAVTTS